MRVHLVSKDDWILSCFGLFYFVMMMIFFGYFIWGLFA